MLYAALRARAALLITLTLLCLATLTSLGIGGALAADEVMAYSQNFESGTPDDWNLQQSW